MPENPLADSPMEKWLRKKNMSTTAFCKMVGCSRPVLWKVKRGLPISPQFANRIVELTDGEVNPKSEPVGGRR